MKRLILIWILIVIANFCFSQTEKSILIDTSKSGINPHILFSFDRVNNKKLYFPEVKFYTINEYQRFFSENVNIKQKRDNQLDYINQYTNITGELYYRYPLHPYNEYLKYKDFEHYNYDPLNPNGAYNFSDAVIMGSINYLFYQFFEK
jgi:hypothetical protein